MTLGKRISELRKEKNLSQVEFAETLGITRSALSHYELNNREPDYALLKKMSDFFDCSVDYLLGKTNKRKWDIETIALSTVAVDGLTEEEINQIRSLIDLMRKKHVK